MTRRHLIKPHVMPEPKSFRTHNAAIAAAKNCGAPNTSVDSLKLKDGSFRAVVLIRPDQAWMTPNILERGVMVYSINTWTPSGRPV